MCSGSSPHCFEPDAAVSNQTTNELEGEIGSASQAPDNQRVAMATARASELPVIIVSGADSPRSRIGRSLESIGGMTAETLQRISTAVGGVMKSPVVLMGKVGGLGSPRAATLTAPPGSSLEERVYHLEIQMKSLEERFNSMTVVTELNPSPHSHKEKPRIVKSLLQEMETDRTLVNRVQILEDGLNKRIEGFEKALSSIQSRLDHIESSRHENVAGFERQESLSFEPQYYDAEQQSDNFGEAIDQNFWGAHDVPSPTLEKSRVKEISSAAPTTAKHGEPLQEIDVGENDDFLEPQVVSTPVYSKEAFLTQPMKSATPSSEPAESVHRDDASNLPASSEQQLASTLEELHGSFVTESLAAAASAKFLEIARAVTTEKGTFAHASSELQSAFALEEPREAFPEEPSAAVPILKSEEHAQEDAYDKSVTPTFEATQKDFTKEPLGAALDAKIAQELATQGVIIIALPSFEPPVISKSMEEASMAVPSANSEEPAQEDTGESPVASKFVEEPSTTDLSANFEEPAQEDTSDESVTMAVARESPKEDFAKESLTSAPSVGPTHEPSSQRDSSTPSDTTLASSESPVASKSVEEPSTVDPSANSKEPAQEDIGDESITMAAARESPKEDFVKESLTSAPRAGPTHEPSSKEDSSTLSDPALASSESPMASKSMEEPSAVDPSANSEEPVQEDTDDRSFTMTTARESPKEDFAKESLTSALGVGSAHEPSSEEDLSTPSDPALASSESPMEPKSVEEPSTVDPSANSKEPAQEDTDDESVTTTTTRESPKEDFAKESLTSASGVGPTHEPSSEEDSSTPSDTTIASSEPPMEPKSVEEPSTTDLGTNFEEPAQEDTSDESVTMAVARESPKEDFVKESLTSAPNVGPTHEPSSQGDSKAPSDTAIASFEPPVEPKSMEEPSTVDPSVNSKEPAQEDTSDESVTMAVARESPKEDFVKESLTSASGVGPTHEPSSEEDSSTPSDTTIASSEPPMEPKSVEEPSTTDLGTNFEEPAQEDTSDKSVTMTAARESPKEDFAKESLTSAPNAGPTHEPSSQGDSSTPSDTTLASSESPVASKSVEEPSTVDPSANSKEPAEEDIGDKSITMAAARESPKEDFVKESLTSAPNAGPIHEPSSQGDSKAPSDTTIASSEPPMEPKSVEEPSTTDLGTNFEEPAQEDTSDKSVTMTAARESPKEDFAKESLTSAPNAGPTHEPSSQGDSKAPSDTTIASSESPVEPKSVEEPSIVDPSANFEEPAQEDIGDESVTMTAPRESPKEDFVKESLTNTPNAGLTHEPSSQGDSRAPSDTTIASSKSLPMEPKSMEELSIANPSANFEEPAQDDAQEDAIGKSGGTVAVAELPSAPSLEGPQEEPVKELPPSVESPQVLETQEDDDMQAPESQIASQSVEEPSTAAPSADFEEPTQENVVDKIGTTMATTKPSLASSYEEPKKDFEKESMASVPSGKRTQEHSDMAIASSEPKGASKFMEEALATTPSANFGEREYKDDANENGTFTASAESPLASFDDLQEDFEKESSTTAPSAELAQELATQEDSSKAFSPPETIVKSKSVEDPSTSVESVGFEEPAHEDVDKGVTTTTATNSPLPIPHEDPQEDSKESLAAASNLPLPISHQDPQEDSKKESLAATPSTESIHDPSSLEDSGATSDNALASFEPQVASKFAEDPSTGVESVGFEEPAYEDVDKGVTTTTATDSPSPIPHQDPQEDFEKESLAAAPSTEPIHDPSSLEDSCRTSDKALASSKPQVASKFVEEPLSNTSNVNFEEPIEEDGAVKSNTVTEDAKSPSVSSFEEPHEEESMATVPDTELAQELATKEDSDMAPFEPQVAPKFVEESLAIDVPSAKFEEHAHENVGDTSGSETTAIDSPSMSPLEAHKEDNTKESLTAGTSAKVLEPTEEDESGESHVAFAPLETPSPSFFGIPQEASLKEPSEASVQPKELVQEKNGIVPPNVDSTLTSTVEEDNHARKEFEYKLAEDFKVHPQHTQSIEKEFPRNQSNLAHVSSEESFATEDSDNHLESDQSDEKFFDVENDSGNFESLEFDEPGEAIGINVVAEKETLVPASSVESEQALKPTRELEQDQAPTRELKEELDQAPAREFKQEPNQAFPEELEQDHESVEQTHAQEHKQQPAQEPKQEDLTRNSALALLPSESQVTSKSGESQGLLVEELLPAIPSTKEEPREANVADDSGTLDLPSTSTMEEPKNDSIVSLEKSLSSASFQQSGNPKLSENLDHESSDTPGTNSTPQETLERVPSTAAPTIEIAQGHDAGMSDNVHKLLEPQLEESKEALANEPVKVVPSSESKEPQEGFVKEPSVEVDSTSKSMDLEDSLADEPSTVTSNAKLAQESVADKSSVELVEESPLTSIVEEPQSDSVNSPAKGKHVKIIAEPTEEIPRTQSNLIPVELNPEATEDATKLQSQGSFLAFGADSKKALAKEPLPSAKLLELFEEENEFGERGPVLADSPMTSTVEEPQKPLVEELLASAKSVPKGRIRRRGFVRSSSEPQFAYKLEEHRKALAKESSVAAIPSASKLGEEHAQEDFGDTQCLPFRILGEGKHLQKESEFKVVEDVKSPMTKSETTSNPYVLEPRPSRIKLKKKKEKKPDAAAEEKERRLSLGLGEMERKSSLRAKDKDSKYSPRAEEKHKQPFKHLRDRLRHAFSVNKEP